MNEYKILNHIKSPKDLDELSMADLEVLCAEIRKKIIQTVSCNGGHLASNLGVVEIAVAIHKTFDSPNDKIIWDVGHQCYAHKLLTGRFDIFDTIRKKGGISGFTKPFESKHDVFISGHASTSLSAACGFAKAELLKGTKHKVIAVIGDGALTGGMAYEALNNISDLDNLIIILNYNNMSISETVGSFSRYISSMRANQAYISTRVVLDEVLEKIPLVGEIAKSKIKNSKDTLKKIVYKSNFFTDLGFSFLSSVDGHNMRDLFQALNWANQTDRPAIIQVFTQKGKGYVRSEKNPGLYHGVGPFDIKNGVLDLKNRVSFSSTFGEQLCNLAKKDKRICAITAAMEGGTGLRKFRENFKNRFFDVGIAEQHAVTYAAGLAASGMIPIFAVYSTFLQRGYDQIVHDAAIQNEHIVLCVDRAGIVGEDGETHQGIFDTAFLTSIPNMTLYCPCNYAELKGMLERAIYETPGLVAVRYPRGVQDEILANYEDFDVSYRVIGESDILIVTYGRLVGQALRARESLKKRGIFVAVMKIGRICPIEREVLTELKKYRQIFFFEEGIKRGGIGEHIIADLAQDGFSGKWSLTAIDNLFVPQSRVYSALEDLGLDHKSMEQKIAESQANLEHDNLLIVGRG